MKESSICTINVGGVVAPSKQVKRTNKALEHFLDLTHSRSQLWLSFPLHPSRERHTLGTVSMHTNNMHDGKPTAPDVRTGGNFTNCSPVMISTPLNI